MCIHVYAYMQFVLKEFLIYNPISCNIHLNFYFTLCCLLHINHVPGICFTCILLSAKTLCHQIFVTPEIQSRAFVYNIHPQFSGEIYETSYHYVLRHNL